MFNAHCVPKPKHVHFAIFVDKFTNEFPLESFPSYEIYSESKLDLKKFIFQQHIMAISWMMKLTKK